MSLLIVTILFIQVAYPAIAEAPPGDREKTKYTVFGYAENVDTEEEISGATVNVYDELENYLGQTTTDIDGYFEKDCWLWNPPDWFEVRITKSQYYQKSKTGTLSGTDCDMGTVSVDPYRKIAVVVGIAEYEDSFYNLPNPDEDALNWTQELLSRDFTSKYIKLLLNSNATKTSIQSNVSWMVDTSRSSDVIAFIYAGHAGPINITSNDDGYLMTYEFESHDNSTGKYHDNELFDDLSDTDALRAFVFIDACRSECFLDEFDEASSGIKSKFFVTSASTWNGTSFDLIQVRDSPPNASPIGSQIFNFTWGIPPAYNGGWTHFFLSACVDNPNSPMESVFTIAYSEFANWYNSTGKHWLWSSRLGAAQWLHERWDWIPGSGTGENAGPGVGDPQDCDGDETEDFYL